MVLEGPTLSEKETNDLMSLLIQRGYFHDKIRSTSNIEDDSSDTMEQSKGETIINFSDTDEACQLLSVHSDCYMTLEEFGLKMETELLFLGRVSVSDFATALGANPIHVEQTFTAAPNVLHEGNELMTSKFLDDLVTRVVTALVSSRGHVLVSELSSHVFSMPMDVTLQVLEERISRGLLRATLVTLMGAKTLVSSQFQQTERLRIRGIFRALTSPTSIDTVCHEVGLDSSFYLPILRDLCNEKELPGELHESDSRLSGAMYVPKVYGLLQRKSMNEFFAANGFVTTEECQRQGVLPSLMGEYILESFPSACVLSKTVINIDVIAIPLEPIIQEASSSSSFVDLGLHLHPMILSNVSDVKIIIDELVVSCLEENSRGITVISDGCGVFVSHGMKQHITKSIIPPLVESWAKVRAQEILNSASLAEQPDGVATDTQGKKQSARERRKGKKISGKHKVSKSQAVVVNGMVPLVTIAEKLAEEYPGLSDVQESYCQRSDDANAPTWSTSGEEYARGPLYDFCRALNTEQFQSSCAQAIKAEVERLQELKNAISIRNRKDGAAKIRSIESAFEDPMCFAAACYSLQLFAKFVDFASKCEKDDEFVEQLKADFLIGCCADFVGRLTHYCLFKNEVEDGILLVDTEDTTTEKSGVPRYCQPLNLACRRYPKSFLRCSDDSDVIRRMPLQALRELLPGSIGVSLARTWTCCGGECYEGGTRVAEDGIERHRPGDMDLFVSLVEENCLSIVGVPFKKLDKKSEKQFLFSRRQALTVALEAATDPVEVLELSIMLLFQQVRNAVVSGRLLTGPILSLLTKERKMTESASSLLYKLSDSISLGEEPSISLVQAVKACGLSRDISKHEVHENAY